MVMSSANTAEPETAMTAASDIPPMNFMFFPPKKIASRIVSNSGAS
jgi:hypothetical protein